MKAHAIVLGAIALVGVWAFVACGGDDSSVHETLPDGSTSSSSSGGQDTGPPPDGSSSGSDGAPQDCFTNPQTHFEIINACTDSQKFDKNPNLPLLLPDGGLPALL
jgi:hypothetical protein